MPAMVDRADYEAEIRKRNFLRAAAIAEEESLGEADLRKSRELAFKQLLGEWFNFRAAEQLAHDWGFGREDVSRMCGEIIKDFEDRVKREGRDIQVFDIARMDHTPVTKLIGRFGERFR